MKDFSLIDCKHIQDKISDGLVFINKKGEIIDVNSSFIKFIGLEREDLIRKRIDEMIIGISRVEFEKKLSRLFYEDGAFDLSMIQFKTILSRNAYFRLQGDGLGGDGLMVLVVTPLEIRQERNDDQDNLSARFQAFVDHLPNGAVFLFDRNIRYHLVEGEALKKLGLKSTDMIGKTLMEVFPPEVSEKAKQPCLSIFNGKSVYYEFSYQNRFFANWGAPVKNKKGKIIEGLVYAIEITELKKKEQNLRKSEEEYRVLAENTSDGILLFDRNHRVVYSSPAYNRVFDTDKSRDSRRGKESIYKHIHPEDRERILKEISEAISKKNKKINCEYRFEQKENQYIWREDRIKFKYNFKGEFENAYVACRNIEKRKKAEIALKESERRFRDVFNNISNVAVQGYDSNRRVTYWNRASEKIYGYSGEEALNEKLEDLIIPEEIKEVVIKNIQNWLDKGIPVCPGELMLKRKDGEYVPVFSSHVMIKDHEGKKEMFCIDLDMTELKEKEKQLVQAKDEAEKSDALKTAFLHNISHEFRTPMNGLLGFSNLIVSHDSSEDEKKLYNKLVQQSVDRLLRVLTDIIELSEVQTSKVEMKKEKFDITNLMDKIVKEFEDDCLKEKKTLNIIYDSYMESHLVISDAYKIYRILHHLISNAVKFTKEKPIEIMIYKKDNETLSFLVKDRGIGIANEIQDKIFEPFERGEQALTNNYGGSGVGLTLVKAYTEALRGKIRLDSKKDHGTKIEVSVPVCFWAEG